MIEVVVNGRGYIEKADFEDIKRGLVSYRTREYVLKTRTPVDNIFNLFRDNLKNIENINIFFETDDEKHKMRNELKKLKNISVTSSLPENLEIGGENTSKAAGILFVADKLGVDKRQIMCFGDGLNDLEMISMAETIVTEWHKSSKSLCCKNSNCRDKDMSLSHVQMREIIKLVDGERR